jgi:hypothetical protein
MALLTLGGMALGIAYTLSPLSIWASVALWLLGRSLVKDLEPSEQRVILAIFVVALVLRVVVLAGLFLSVDHASTPFGSLFGDEEYLKRRSLWLRSMALGVNVSEADRAYALEEYSETSYLYWLAFLQMIVGDAPYGVHVLSMVAYLAGAVWLFRFLRPRFGPAPAALSFFGVLFYPTLFFWSVSALRESVHFLLVLAAIAGAIDVLTGGGWQKRGIGVLVASLALLALKDLREGSMAIVLVAIVTGALAAAVVRSGRRLLITTVAVALVAGVSLSRPAIQDRVMAVLRTTALRHQGHAFTAGIHYKTLDPRFYEARTLNIINDIKPPEAARYVVRALIAALVVPWPWQAETRLLKAYLPEHLIWLLMAALFPVGIWAGARRESRATFIMAAYVVVMFVGVALYSGNVGTLVRHRGLLLPFVISISAVAVCDLLARAGSARSTNEGILSDGADR